MGLFDFLMGTKRPPAGTPVLSRQEVLVRLKELSRPTAPWGIVDGGADGVDLVAEWRVHERRFHGPLQQSAASRVFRVLLKLDELEHEVRASDREYVLKWGVDGPTLSLAGSAFRGQKHEVRFGAPPAYTEALPSGEVIEYRFAANELKKPLQDAVTGCGWTYRGVAFGKL